MSSKSIKMAVPAILSRFTRRISKAEIDRIRMNPGRILLVRQNERLGNIVLMNSAISALKSRFPSCEIDLLLPGKFSAIMEGDKRIEKIIPVQKKDFFSMPWRLLALIKMLRRRTYDIAIDCSDVDSHSSTGAAYTLLSGARVRAGWENDRFFQIDVPRYDGTVHAIEMYLRLFTGVFGEVMSGDPYFDGQATIPMNDTPVVGINCGGRDKKKWPIENFVKLGEILSRSRIAVEYILGPDELREREYLSANLPAGCGIQPLLQISELKRVFRRYSAFVSSDTGPMHVAWSLGIPVVAIFLSSDIEKYRPLSEGSVIIDGSKGIDPNSISESVMRIIESRRISV